MESLFFLPEIIYLLIHFLHPREAFQVEFIVSSCFPRRDIPRSDHNPFMMSRLCSGEAEHVWPSGSWRQVPNLEHYARGLGALRGPGWVEGWAAFTLWKACIRVDGSCFIRLGYLLLVIVNSNGVLRHTLTSTLPIYNQRTHTNYHISPRDAHWAPRSTQ